MFVTKESNNIHVKTNNNNNVGQKSTCIKIKIWISLQPSLSVDMDLHETKFSFPKAPTLALYDLSK